MVQPLPSVILDYLQFDDECDIAHLSLVSLHLIKHPLDPGVIVYIKRLAAGVLSTINNSSDADGKQYSYHNISDFRLFVILSALYEKFWSRFSLTFLSSFFFSHCHRCSPSASAVHDAR